MSEVTTTQAAAQETKSVITKMDLLKAWFKWCTAVEGTCKFSIECRLLLLVIP